MKRGAVVGSFVLALAWMAVPAWGHAEFQNPQQAGADADQTLTMEVAEERGPDLHNAKVIVEAPAGFTVNACHAPTGWTCSIEPAPAGGTRVTFSGAGKAQTFSYDAHTPAKTGNYAFTVSQTYTDGKVVLWDGPETSDHPAPVLAVVAGAAAPGMGDHHMGGGMPSCTPNGTSLTITAKDLKFDKDCLAAPAGVPFTITLVNNDTVEHNIVIHRHDTNETLFRGDLAVGPKTVTYHVPALPAGTYHFHCEPHSTTMNGTFIVAAAAPPPMAMSPPPPAASASPGPAASSTPGPSATPPAPAPAATAPSPRTAAAAPTPGTAAAASSPSTQAAPTPATGPATSAAVGLARTGSGPGRTLLPSAGLAFAVGGGAIIGGARRTRRNRAG